MNLDNKILSDITVHMKYAKFQPLLSRRENWNEIVQRNMDMHIKKFPELESEIREAYQFVLDKKVLPSMRSMQFAGRPIEINPARIYNCAYLPVNDWRAFSEIMFLLLGGTGIGFSVQTHHIESLPEIKKPTKDKSRRFLIGDSIEGWADAVKVLMKSYYKGGASVRFDYSDIRPKGALLVTAGGKAPGPAPLRECLVKIEGILESAEEGKRLSSLQVHDIVCHIADAVLAGGIRRAALISLFSADDDEMIACKSGNWWELNPQRGRANNSAVLLRQEVTEEYFFDLWKRIELSNSGEPGIYFTNDSDWGTNPCVTGDTEILTKKGYEKIENLINKEVEIWNGFEWSNVTPKITGYNQPIIKVTLSDGRELTSTHYHNWHIAEGYNGKSKKVKTQDLKIGDKIIKYKFPIIEDGVDEVTLKEAYTQGFISAEGMEDYNYIWLYEPKYMCKHRLDVRLEGSEVKNINGVGRKQIYYNNEYKAKDFVPFNWSVTNKLEWLAGLFDGDGTELIEGGLQLCSINRSFLKDVQKLLSTIGINCKVLAGYEEGFKLLPDGKGGEKEYFCNTSYRICIGAVQMQELKSLGLSCERMSFNKSPQRDASQFAKVIKIEDVGYADTVYCFNEPKRNYGVFNGILTGQCVEIALRPFQFCNLCEINAGTVQDQEDLNARAKAASFIGTLQASNTDFHYLRSVWKRTTEKDALIGVGMTGIADGKVTALDLNQATNIVVEENIRVAHLLGINSAARTTCVKPSGTTSLVLGTSSGIHGRHSKYYLRRIRVGKNEAIYSYLKEQHPELVEDCYFRPHDTAIISVPQASPEGSILRNETPIDLLNRVKLFSDKWIKPGHQNGINSHNVSATISIKADEWEDVGKWMWENKDSYNGLSVLPYDGGTYVQAPFEEITEKRYNELIKSLTSVNLDNIQEQTDTTDLSGELACAGGACEI